MTDPGVRFALTGAALFALLYWLFNGNGPLPALNALVAGITEFQTAVAALLLHLGGVAVERGGTSLSDPTFSCTVGEACNGFSAVTLAAAAILAWPSSVRSRLGGLAVVLPIVLAVNIIRIAALWWVGRHSPAWFDAAHVYGGQVFVIAGTLAAWGLWLSWNAPRRPASS